ncbi:hypothetical protein A2392_00670 [Candidatus Kaiserbacteria bacterium RIFOXYB1_FULL_46_14]|uniref:Uncharacterized protein n=1 Tax=Candidatus Kaiserbacteria bacterium RIFOXYB1_FULL_46_14 TaxID=1798531 RepID=A0A1F6FJ76_9BACT|nr:MAG: hypothetical protein A2392_00670 [Candidatus Kaiserbacteria bacterium RIFOXYB1_FULL_46_14]
MIVVYIPGVSLIVSALLLASTGYLIGTPLKILQVLVPSALLAITIALYMTMNDRERLVWNEFQQHHDLLVKELCITQSSASLHTILYQTNKCLARKGAEIQYSIQAFQSDGIVSVPSPDEIGKFYAKGVDYWHLYQACEYMGLVGEEVPQWPVVKSAPVQMGRKPLSSPKS